MFTQNGLVFELDSPLRLTQDVQQAIGYATSVGVGSQFNVEENLITGYSLAIPGLQSITNPISAKGGSDAETVNQAISRGLSFLQFRHVTTPREYEIVAQSILGSSYKVKAFSYFEIQDFLFSNDRLEVNSVDEVDPRTDLGRRNIYLVCTDNLGQGVNVSEQNKVKNYLLPRTQAGTEVIFLNPEIIYIDLVVETLTTPSNNPLDSLVTALRDSQKVLYTGIGRSLRMASLYDLAETYTPIKVLSAEYLDNDFDRNSILSFSDRGDDFIPPYPNTVWLIQDVVVKTPNGDTYTYTYNLYGANQ
jgi:hypothetical protein